MKRCCVCKKWKEPSCFYKETRSKDGLGGRCKICNNECVKAHHRTEKGNKILTAYNKKWSKENSHKKREAGARRFATKLKATASWGDRAKIETIYKEARDLTEKVGVKYEVDHIVPLRSDLVCGLHVESNLRVVLRTENRIKSNLEWPDRP